MLKRWVVLALLAAALLAAEYEQNDWTYFGFWNLYNSGYDRPTAPALVKKTEDQAKWSATMYLRNFPEVHEYIGKKMYFISEYTGPANAARLAPSFFVIKDGRTYEVWWNIADTNDRQYLNFWARGNVLTGFIEIPDPAGARFWARLENGQPFAVTNSSPVTLADVRGGLRTNWQHDIPGAYSTGSGRYAGSSGQAQFYHFYLGAEPPLAVLSPAQARQLGNLPARDREILENECGLPQTVFAGDTLPANYYYFPADEFAAAQNFYKKYKKDFASDIYFQKKNYLPRGANGFNVNIIANDPGATVENLEKLTVRNKQDPYAWTIIALGGVEDARQLAELQGVARLTVWYDARDLRSGYYGWQNAFLDVVQYDQNGKIVGWNDDLIFPVLNRTTNIAAYSGILEHEFIVVKDAVRLEIILKISGAPDYDQTKRGATVGAFALNRVALQKGVAKLDVEKLFKVEAPLVFNGANSVYLRPAGLGLFVGDRSLAIDPARRNIKYNLQNPAEYSGFYTNIFNVDDIGELEIAAVFNSKLQKYGDPPSWANNAIELIYFDENGEQVYPADNGAERYPRVDAALNTTQTRKSLFVVPRERGAKYAQIRMNFVRANDSQDNRPDRRHYFLGQAGIENIIIRPALQTHNAANFLPDNGSFYDNINGQPLNWTVQGAYVEENLPQAARKLVFNNWNTGGWSAVKTEIDIPPSANALRGRMNIDLQNIETGLNQWEGFGFFLEADVQTPSGALFHYSGIPVFEKKGGQYVQFSRLSLARQGLIEYYIQLYHENQKIVKLYWQIALLGKGRAELLPLNSAPEANILSVELLQEPAFNPLLWSQYSLYSADSNSFQFQKNYELKTADGSFNYDYAEVLAERLLSTGLEKQNIAGELKKLPLDAVKKTAAYEIKTLPAYGRVSTLADFDGQVIEVSFRTDGTEDARFNLQAFIVDEKSGNVHQAPIYRLEKDGSWKTIDRVFEAGQAERFVIDSAEYPGEAKKALLTLGGFHGIVNYRDLKLTNYAGFDKRSLTGRRGETKISALGGGRILTRASAGKLNQENLVSLTEAYPLGFLSTDAQKLDAQIRAAVKTAKLGFERGAWTYRGGNGDFALTGFTLVGETFQTWQQIYGADLPRFCREQGERWKKAGLNTIRVHQVFTSWADFSEKDLDQLIKILKSWQDEGFVIIFDALPDTNFAGNYWGALFNNKPYTAAFSNATDLFKATLVLPEVSSLYVKPALQKLAKSFQKNNFWPNSLTYMNETGFTRGFWTIDKYNAVGNKYFSQNYHFYYGRYLDQTRQDKAWQDFIARADALLQTHLQSVNLKSLLADVAALNNVIDQKYYVKDTASYIYYNVLRDEALNRYPAYQKELKALREDGYSWITNAEPTGNYVERSAQIAVENKTRLNKLLLQIEVEQNNTAKNLQSLLTAADLKNKIKAIHSAVFSVKMPADYQIPENLTLGYVDDFANYDRQQSFFTSFLLPVVFVQDVNAFLRQQTTRNFVVGLNNDYARDAGALLGNAYLFFNDPHTELRFNKYTHHPIGGHSMLLNPGFGNLFDEDSNIDLNLELFTPPAGYPAQLSETNFTFAGDDKSGEGAWTIMDYLRGAAKRKNILFFHNGPNVKDKPILSDYFNIGNRPYKLNALALVSSVALQKRLDPQYIMAGDFQYDRFQEKIDLKAKGVNGIAGRVARGGELRGRAVSFVYKGKRPQTNVTVIEQRLNNNKETVIYFFGLERNKDQQNRAGNPDLVQLFGENVVQYESLPGLVKIANRRVSKITGYYPSGRTVDIPLRYLRLDNGLLEVDLTAFPGIVCCQLTE